MSECVWREGRKEGWEKGRRRRGGERRKARRGKGERKIGKEKGEGRREGKLCHLTLAGGEIRR